MLLSSQQRVSGQVNPHGLYRPRVLSPKCQIVDAEACLQVVSTNLRVLRIGSPISRHLSYKANNLAHNGPRFAPQMAIQEVRCNWLVFSDVANKAMLPSEGKSFKNPKK